MSVLGVATPLVLVPGEVVDSRIWDDQVAAFAERYQVVRFDLRRSGRSESGTEPFTYVSDMATVLGTLQVDPAYLVGIADGANLAVEYALEYPHQVEALVLVGPSIRGYVPETISPEAARTICRRLHADDRCHARRAPAAVHRGRYEPARICPFAS